MVGTMLLLYIFSMMSGTESIVVGRICFSVSFRMVGVGTRRR